MSSYTHCVFSFLGYVDMLGVAYEAPSLATGYGAYLAQVSSGPEVGEQIVVNPGFSGCLLPLPLEF